MFLYTVDPITSRTVAITDRCGAETEYEYDSMGRTTKVTSGGSSVSYGYNALDNMTEIVRGDGMKYVLEYDAFHNLESIGIDGKNDKLIEYTYRDHNGRLKKIAYANGDYARLGYDRYGNMISEQWFDKNGLLTYKYVYAYDNEGNIVKTIDNENFKEYNYIYDEGKLIRAVEYDVTIENDVVTSKTKVVSIVYVYNEEGELVKRKAAYPDGAVTGNTPSTYTVNGKEINGSEFFITPSIEEEVIPFVSVVTTTDTDELGRKTSDSVGKTANGIVRSFTYVEGLDPTELGGYNEYVLSQNKVDLAQDKYKPTTRACRSIFGVK